MRPSITSEENSIYKDFLRLGRRKYRDREGRFIIEGENLVREALDCNKSVLSLVISEESELEPDHPKARIMDRQLFRNICQTKNSQGVMAILEKPAWDREEVLGQVGGNILVLDRIQDPGNLGTMIRTAEAAGYSGVMVIKGTCDPYGPKTVRAAAGAILRMPVIGAGNAQEAINTLKIHGKTLVVTSMDSDNNYYNVNLTSDIALVMGNEGEGCSREFMEAGDLKVAIPMKGSLESLNVSVAAGLLMYENIRNKSILTR